MTVRSLKLIACADAIVHDRLIPPGALDRARADAEIHDVGKLPGVAKTTQEQINERLIELARGGANVVRLKGGDPLVFGRGGEEAEALVAAGVPFEVVPGPTAGIAASAYAGIPVTQRGVAAAVAFLSGHDARDGTTDWRALAMFPGTLVFYMGVSGLAAITEGLVSGGRRESEPAAVISNGTLPDQATIVVPLGEIAAVAAEAQVKPPAITVVGDVAALSAKLSWSKLR